MITDTQIERLRDEAFAAGDALQGYVCRLALGTLYTEAELAEVSCLDHSERKELLAMSQEEARAECESVIQE